MKYEITYTKNAEGWKIDRIAAEHGYAKTDDCYWVQIYRNDNGDSIVATRDDASPYTKDDGTAWRDPAELLAAMLGPQPEEPAQQAAEADQTVEKLEHARQALEARNDRSAWSKGVTAYALELLEQVAEGVRGGYITADDLSTPAGRRAAMLNGASDWSAYSRGGSALIYNGDIAERLCTPSELKRTRGGERRPNSREEWLDTQARALHQAANRAACAIKEG